MLCGISDPQLPSLLAEVLGSGGVVIMPCDTVYGFVGVAPDTGSRICSIKRRAGTKAFIQLIPHEGWLERFGIPPLPRQLRRYWPGPLTVVFPRGQGETVAIRVPRDDLLRQLLLEVGKPLYSTSVNRSGEQPETVVQRMVERFGGEVDLIVDGGTAPGRVVSTILDITSVPYRVLRHGAVRIPENLLHPQPHEP